MINEKLCLDILGIENREWSGGCIRFSCNYNHMKELLILRQIDLSDHHNDSPTVREFLEFCDRNDCHESVTFGGYVITEQRSDARVSFEEIYLDVSDSSPNALLDFVDRFRLADEFELKGTLRAWWD